MFAQSLGQETYGPPVPTSTQVAVQTGRDILTSRIPLDTTTLLYIAGGTLALYLVYQYLYSSEA